MIMIGERFNMEDVFFRDLTACVLDTLEGQIRWVNRFSSGDFPVEVPFYYSLTGDERFLLDTFQDDIVSENRFIELNTDIIPRGHLTMKSFNITSDEFANPNVWLKMVVENEYEIRKILAKVRAVPIVVDYDLTILLANEIDTFKCSQAIMDTLWIYKFMYFEHNFMNIDAVMLLPDTNQIEINREKNMSSDNNIKLTVSFQVQTYYPAFRKDRVSPTGYPRFYGDGPVDMNAYNLNGGISTLFPPGTNPNVNNNSNITPGTRPVTYPDSPPPNNILNSPAQPWDPITGDPGDPGDPVLFQPPSSGTFSNTGTGTVSWGGDYPTGSSPTQDTNYYMYSPRRSRWFSNILRARQQAMAPNLNPNAGNPNPTNGPN